MARHTRYQGAIVKDHQILLIRLKRLGSGRAFWVIPGGGMEGSESEETCVAREMSEETNLEVRVVRLLIDEPAHPGGVYQRIKTYLCHPISGEASPGFEPEPEAADYSITEVRWFNLTNEGDWDERLRQDPITYPQLVKIRQVLGYDA